jgi:YgiT-type zinc finger domain-containing protein
MIDGNLLLAFYYKRKSFEHERELRAAFTKIPTKNGTVINLAKLKNDDYDIDIDHSRGCLTMVVKCVPALVCPNCGEAYISESVTTELLKDAEERSRTGAQVEIRQHVAA